MMDRNAAFNRGAVAARQAHQQLGLLDYLVEKKEQVDVFSAIHDLSITTICRPLDGLLGAYLNKPDHGILVSTQRRLPIQRFTAAHELGHYWLDHSSSKDTEKSIGEARSGTTDSPIQEIEAESFAAEFLLPRFLLVNIAKKMALGKFDLKIPKNVYQMSLRTGTSYSSTVYALKMNNLIDSNTRELLLKSSPKESKIAALDSSQSFESDSDIFLITNKENNATFKASPNDTIIFELEEHSAGGYAWSSIENNDNIEILNVEKSFKERNLIGNSGIKRILLRGTGAVDIQLIETRQWDKEQSLLNQFNSSIDFQGKEVGLPRVAR